MESNTVKMDICSPLTDAFPAGLRFLVVDEDPTWLKILEKMLKKCSCQVSSCSSARAALELLRERKEGFDIVISDVNVPDMDGFKLIAHIGLEMDLPVIMMTVDGQEKCPRLMKGIEHGACDYLLKPIRMKELRNLWQHVFRKKIHEVRNNETVLVQEPGNGADQMRGPAAFVCGEDPAAIKKRKGVDEDNICFTKKSRVVWTVEVHQKFIEAVHLIGFDRVGPQRVVELMDVAWLTRENVAAHLQKYRLYLRKIDQFYASMNTSVHNWKHFSGSASSESSTGYSCNMSPEYVFNRNSSIFRNMESLSYQSDSEETRGPENALATSKMSISVDSPGSWNSGFINTDSSESSESEMNLAKFDSTFLFTKSRDHNHK